MMNGGAASLEIDEYLPARSPSATPIDRSQRPLSTNRSWISTRSEVSVLGYQAGLSGGKHSRNFRTRSLVVPRSSARSVSEMV